MSSQSSTQLLKETILNCANRDIKYDESKPLEDNWNCFKDMMNEATENHVPKMKVRQKQTQPNTSFG